MPALQGHRQGRECLLGLRRSDENRTQVFLVQRHGNLVYKQFRGGGEDEEDRVNHWYDKSRAILERLKLKPDDPEARRTIREAYPFGERRRWPYVQWLKAVGDVYPWTRKPKQQKPLPKWLGGKG